MPLGAIITRLSTTTGFDQSVANNRAFLVDQLINVAAKKLYDEHELRNCNREQIFNVLADQQQIVLPWYVDRVIGARDYDTRLPMQQVDMRARYQMSDWIGLNFNVWRTKQQEYPLEREIINAGLLRLTFDKALVSGCIVTITGKTATAENEVEIVTFAAGDTEKYTVNSWEEIRSIQKTANTSSNLGIYDLNDNKIAFIANFAERSKYVLLQVMERFQQYSPARLMEVLFRPIWRPFRYDTDIFMCGDAYDDAIYWASLTLHYSRRSDADSIKLAIAARTEMLNSINLIAGNTDDGHQFKMNFGANIVYTSTDNMRLRYVNSDNYPWSDTAAYVWRTP